MDGGRDMTETAADRRKLLGLGALGGIAAVTASTPALAQGQPDTLQRIRDRKELRVGVAPGEPWFYKDQRTNEWHGIGWGVAVGPV